MSAANQRSVSLLKGGGENGEQWARLLLKGTSPPCLRGEGGGTERSEGLTSGPSRF